VATILLVAVGAPYVYINFIRGEAPAPLELPSATGGVSTGGAGSEDTGPNGADSPSNEGIDGTWEIAAGSIVGYRVDEVLLGQTSEAVGRTEQITGSVTADGTSVTDASFTVDMTTVTSDEPRRDEQFQGRIMETAQYPTATFVLTSPIDLGAVPTEGTEGTYTASGDLELHGVTAPVTFEIAGRYSGSTAELVGRIAITFEDWGIANPSFAGVVTTEDHGLLEFSLVLTRS
jgi:polyisoprenoid-binding protein YceI